MSYFDEVLRAIRDLTPVQRRVFDQLCVGNDGGHSQRTLDSLARLGLVGQYEEPLRGAPRFIVYRYSVPSAVHVAWAQLCSEEIDSKKEER